MGGKILFSSTRTIPENLTPLVRWGVRHGVRFELVRHVRPYPRVRWGKIHVASHKISAYCLAR